MAYTFTYVASMEELESEFRGCTREITEMVMHWSANFIDQDLGAEEIHSVHQNMGFSGCAYHYIVKRDGTVQRGRPLNIKGAHAAELGHNNYSIGFAFVAGYNCTSGTRNPNRYISADSITQAQWDSAKKFVGTFFRVWPGGQVLGHNDTDNNKVDPGIDIESWITTTFNRRNAREHTRDLGPLSTSELIQLRASQRT